MTGLCSTNTTGGGPDTLLSSTDRGQVSLFVAPNYLPVDCGRVGGCIAARPSFAGVTV